MSVMSSWGGDKELWFIPWFLSVPVLRHAIFCLKSRWSTFNRPLKPSNYRQHSSQCVTVYKNMFTRIRSASPPSSVTSKLDRAASTSSISGSLEWSSGSLDSVSLQMWYWERNQMKVFTLFIFEGLLLELTALYSAPVSASYSPPTPYSHCYSI